MLATPPPDGKGTYLLLLRLPHNQPAYPIGRLGTFDLARGYYLYVGSAFGPGGLAARIGHHSRRQKARPHWHIDHLRSVMKLQEVWCIVGPLRLESSWCEALTLTPGFSMPVRGFGSSDTRAPSHLFYSPVRPAVAMLSHALIRCLLFSHPEAQNLCIEIVIGADTP